MHFTNSFEQVVGSGLFDQVARGASFRQLLHVIIVAVGRQNEDLRTREGLSDLSCRLQAVQHRHRDINDGDIGGKFPGQLHRLSAVVGFAHNFDVLLSGQKGTQPLANHNMIIS